jgi:uncharacterized membrane protein YeiB
VSHAIVGAISDLRRRIAFLDLLRGPAIFLTVIVNSLFDHVAVAPMFLFSIGVS